MAYEASPSLGMIKEWESGGVMGDFSEKEALFVRKVGAGKVTEANEMVLEGSVKLDMKVLAAALRAGLSNAKAESVDYALRFYNDERDGKRFYQFFSKPYFANGSWRYEGESAWLHLLTGVVSTKYEDGPSRALEECALALSRADVGLHATLSFQDGRTDRKVALLHQLAARGLLDWARKIEKEKGNVFAADGLSADDAKNVPDDESPLSMALRCGHGEMALWLLKKGGSHRKMAVFDGFKGWLNPHDVGSGIRIEPNNEDRLLCGRLGAYLTDFAQLESCGWATIEENPLSENHRLQAWLMLRGARAQATGLDYNKRLRLIAENLAEKRGETLGGMPSWPNGLTDEKVVEVVQESVAKPKGFFARLARSKASTPAPSDAHFGIWLEAKGILDERVAKAPALASVIMHLDQSQFDAAKEALHEIPQAKRLDACVALLGLAKSGFWDMPMPGGVGDQCRNPLRWAGFKMALIEFKEQMDRPIDGLQGMTLLGLSAALGFPDACQALIEAGARLDPDPLTESASPLLLAIRHGRDEIAKALLASGASPMEGAKDGPFGFEPKERALHLALEKGFGFLVRDMLEREPTCCKLRGPAGLTIYEELAAIIEDPDRDGDKEACKGLLATAERAGLRALSSTVKEQSKAMEAAPEQVAAEFSSGKPSRSAGARSL